MSALPETFERFAEDGDNPAGLDQVPVEIVEIRPESRIVIATESRSLGADRFRYLRMRLRELRAKAKLQSVVITSPLPQDGKSTVALNLATVLAEKGKHKVALIEADLHHPTLAGSFGIASQPGLSECLEGDLNPIALFRRIEPLGWYLLQAGTPVGNPTELLQSPLLPKVLETLSSHFDWILIDTPPVAPLTDAVSISRIADGTLLVVRADQTPSDAVEEAVSVLGPGRIAGIIFNGAEGLNSLYSKYSYYYGKKK